ncbi:MAG: hypothetical protein ACYCW6_02460 [Candidatus Xenobia bacterium]
MLLELVELLGSMMEGGGMNGQQGMPGQGLPGQPGLPGQQGFGQPAGGCNPNPGGGGCQAIQSPPQCGLQVPGTPAQGGPAPSPTPVATNTCAGPKGPNACNAQGNGCGGNATPAAPQLPAAAPTPTPAPTQVAQGCAATYGGQAHPILRA